MAETLNGLGTFTVFAPDNSAFSAAGLSANVLATTGNLTVFAPTNEAFMQAGFPTIASIQNANPATLTKILTYHVLSGRSFSSDLRDNTSLETLNGDSLTVSLGNQAGLQGNSNDKLSIITNANLMAKNGVIHIIDNVLLP